jgi:transposase
MARALQRSRPTVRQALTTLTEPVDHRQHQPLPTLGEYQAQLEHWLEIESCLPRRQRRTAKRLFEGLQVAGSPGSDGPIQRLVTRGKAQRARTPAVTHAFVPLAFPPGETGQFDWSHEEVELGGVVQTIQVAHVRLTDSRQMFVVADPRETQERVFEAPVRAVACFGGAPLRMVDDHLKTVVDTLLIGKDRQFNRRFLTLANHDLFEPVACPPASGGEKGQVENPVGNVRDWRFTPRLTFTDFTA